MRCRRLGIRPTVKVEGATQLRYGIVQGRDLVADMRLSERGVSIPEVKFFMDNYSKKGPYSKGGFGAEQVPFNERMNGTHLLILPKGDEPKIHFFENSDWSWTDLVQGLNMANCRWGAVGLGNCAFEFLERAYCWKNSIDYDQMVRQRQKAAVNRFSQLLTEARREKQLADTK